MVMVAVGLGMNEDDPRERVSLVAFFGTKWWWSRWWVSE